MFRIESYVTPIILENVAKYVKNIRPQDFQMSLWEGEVGFANLDLRLDVLEEELNLPFEFLSGHIHELNIRVPWTKIVAEPIRITINTIEFILKLKDKNNDVSSSSATSSPQHKQQSKRSSSIVETPQQPQPPARSGLVNKILQNISIECHNIILKYVEEDIVVSMNVQHLSFGSANENWNVAMIDVHPVKVLMRKLVKISDLTICLDKRNSAGQIEVCQEPILYRCTLECRILQKYNVNTKSTTSSTRVALFSKAIDMNISALQFPMIMRLVNLMMTLKSGNLKSGVVVDSGEEDLLVEDAVGEGNESYLSWAWNMLPSFSFELPYGEDSTDEEPPGHTLNFGTYFEEVNFTFKNSELIVDSLLGGAKRIRYSPVVRVSFGGIYYELVKSEERHWCSVKAGVSNILIEPLGTYKSDDYFSSNFLEGETLSTEQSFIDKSLFDEKYIMSDKNWGATSYDDYMAQITDEYLLYRSPILAFDFIEYKAPKSQEEKELPEEVPPNDLEKHTEYRLLSAGMTFRYNQAFLQVKNVISDFIKSYDYPAYHAENLEKPSSTSVPKLHPPLMEDFDALMQHIPICSYTFDIRKIKIEIYPKTEPEPMPKQQQRRSNDAWKQALPYFELTLKKLEGSFITPLDPDKLVHTTCQLPNKPAALVNACYDLYHLELVDLSLTLINKIANRSSRLLNIPALDLNFGKLLKPQLWKEDELPQQKLNVNCDHLIVEFSKRESIAHYRLINSILHYHSSFLWKLSNQMPNPLANEDLIKMQNEFIKIYFKKRTYHSFTALNFTLRNWQSSFTSMPTEKQLFISTTSKLHNLHNKWFEFQAQIPNEGVELEKQVQPLMAVWVETYRIIVDSSLLKFLKYQEDFQIDVDQEQSETQSKTQTLQASIPQLPPQKSQPTVLPQLNSSTPPIRKLSRASASQRKTTNPEETIHFSSERDDKTKQSQKSENVLSKEDQSNLFYVNYLKKLILFVDVAKGHINICETVYKNAKAQQYTNIQLAKVLMKSAHTDLIIRSNTRRKSMLLQPDLRTTVNWSIILNDFQIQRRGSKVVEDILNPVQTTITISLATKKESYIKHQQNVGSNENKKSPKKKKKTNEKHVESSASATEEKDSTRLSFMSLPRRESSFIIEEDEDLILEDDAAAMDDTLNENENTIKKREGNTAFQKHIVSFNLHADTTPIVFLVSSRKFNMLYKDINFIAKIVTQMKVVAAEATEKTFKTIESIKIITAAEEHPELKSFVERETQSAVSEFSDDVRHILLVFSLLCQWTITKIKVELENDFKSRQNCKVILELEDLLFTLDKREDYTKMTNKIGQFNLIYYEQISNDEWKEDESLRVKILGESTNLPFLNIIITNVGLKSFFDKMGINHKDNNKQNRTLMEVLIAMEAIEIIFDMDKVTNLLQPFCVLFERNSIKTEKVKTVIAPNERPIQSNPAKGSDLPLLQFDSKGIMIYFPLETTQDRCSVTILKIESIKVSSNLDNPLPRNPIRNDVYSKAAQLGMLNTPGSLIEDRQYELKLRNISLSTASWSQALLYMREQTNNLLRSNPAFEWNNPNRASGKNGFQSSSVFHSFTFQSTYAPCIVYNNILISGQAIEFNCVSDFVAELDLHQMGLIFCTIRRLQNLSILIDRICHPRAPCDTRESGSLNSFYSLESYTESSSEFSIKKIEKSAMVNYSSKDDKDKNYIKTDSGFQSSVSRLQTSLDRFTNAINSNDHFSTISSTSSVLQERYDYTQPIQRMFPFTISLVAGIFLIKITERVQLDKLSKIVPTAIPVFSIIVSQPSFMFTQNIYDSVSLISLFNLNFNINKFEDDIDEEDGGRISTESTEHNVIIDTLVARDSFTGIPPPLFVMKLHRNKMHILEVDIEVSKWLLITFNERCVKQLYKYYLRVLEVLYENPCLNMCDDRTIVRLSKIKLMRQQFLNADHLHFNCDKITIVFTNEMDYNCKLVLAEAKANIKFLMRPEKATMKLSIASCYLQTENKILVHPIAVRASADFVIEPWYRLPLVTITLKFGVVHIDFGIGVVLQLRETLHGITRILELMTIEWKKYLSHRAHSTMSLPHDRLTHIKCPPVCDEKNQKHSKYNLQREEFYQDDLRAGAFQFVELMTESFLPLPYQIQIIKKKYGIICWRYPQPRKMCNIQVFPIPMATDNPIHIKCRMEYFSEVHEGFQYYCDFSLSETVSKVIKLPQRNICANIWRVIILQSLIAVNGECFENSDEDEELHSIPSKRVEEAISFADTEPDFMLHPKILVGCMRIDTSFKSKSVPKVKLLISCPLLKISILNQPNQNGELPQLFKKFRITQLTLISQTIFEICMENINLHASFLSSQNFILENDFNFQIKFLDQGFLNMLYLIEKAKVQNVIDVNRAQKDLKINTVIDRLRLNIGPTLIQTLYTTKYHWEEFLNTNKKDIKALHAVIPKFLVVNRTYVIVSFGQTGTTERIQLQRRECHLYSFYSDYHNQELTFFINDDETHITEASQSVPISLKFEGESVLQYIRIGNKCIIIKSLRLSATQIGILIKGQIEFLSMVPHELYIDFRIDGSSKKADVKRQDKEYIIDLRGRCCFYKSVQRKTNIFMRIKALQGGKGRSGDIPLKTNKNLPWLVKVPTQNNNFISFWVRILREDISELSNDNFEPQKVLITVWPIFVISSMLTSSTQGTESVTNKEFNVLPCAGRHILNVPATHLTEHNIKFKFDFPIGKKSTDVYTLSLKKLDWNKFFFYDESLWTIEYAITELGKGLSTYWPLNDEEEERVRRSSNKADITDIIYKVQPSRDFSCAQCLEVSPWGLFINATDQQIKICDYDKANSVVINSNYVSMLFNIERAFTVNIKNGSNWLSSLPIFITENSDEISSTIKYYFVSEAINSIDILILLADEVLKFVLEYKMENGRCILRLRSKFAVTNFTKINLCMLPFAIDHKETISIKDLKMLDTSLKKPDLYPTHGNETCIGRYCNTFCDLNGRSTHRSSDTAFIFFICFKMCTESDISIPIPLSMPFARRCFSVQNGTDSVPLIVTLLEKDNIFYLNVFDDVSPAILVNNNTDVDFIIAQTYANENTEVSSISREYNDRHFDWIQNLNAYSKCYYTPPQLYLSFPDVESTVFNVAIALYKENVAKKDIKWSKAIGTDQTWQKYLHVPNHGDVKVSICDKHRTIQISISYISQQMEFSAKEIRSRLLLPGPQHEYFLDNRLQSSITFKTSTSKTEETPTVEVPTKPIARCVHFSQDCLFKQQTIARFFVKEIVISINTDCKERDFMKREILNLYVDDLMVAYDDLEHDRTLNVLFGNIQVDNQLYSTGRFDFPVILCSETLYKYNSNQLHVHFLDVIYQELLKGEPMAALKMNFFIDEFSLSSVNCLLRPVRVYIEDSYLNELLDALIECDPGNCVYRPELHIEPIVLADGLVLLPKDIVTRAICIAEPLRLRSFKIEPLNVLLSVHTSVRMYIALDHSPLSFSAYERRHLLTIPLRLGHSLGRHYLSGALFGAGWVVGSLEILGSPSGLARSFSTGFRDFVSLPVQGLFRGPWGFIVGITQGSASLLRNVTAGTVNSVTKLAASVARNLDRLSLDTEHIERTDALRRARPQGFTDGISQGLTGLGISILGAVGGLAHHTLEANSPVEIVTGFGKGIVGAFTKPISGAVELVALAGQGMLHSVGFNAMPQLRAPSVTRNVATNPSSYRIWKLLPGVLATDQILVYQEISLMTENQMRCGYVVLTSAVFVLMEAQWDKLTFICPIGKVKIIKDHEDKRLFYVSKIEEHDEIEQDLSYTNQRIMQFLHSSNTKEPQIMTNDSLHDLLLTRTTNEYSQINAECSFYVYEHIGDHIIQYMKVMLSS